MEERIERRFLLTQDEVQFRAYEDKGKKYLEGYAALYNVRSKILFNNDTEELFYEVIKPGAFDKVLSDPNQDVTFNFQHNDNYLLARTGVRTLVLTSDDKGLRFTAEVPDTTYGRDIYALVQRGDLNANSFAFFAKPEDYNWGEFQNNLPVGTLTNVRKLKDVSVVVNAAYPETSIEARSEVAKRSYDDFKTNLNKDNENAIQNMSNANNKRYIDMRMRLINHKVDVLKNKINKLK